MKGCFFMYSIDVDKYFGYLNWQIICWGIKNDIIDVNCAIDYAHKLVERNVAEDESLVVELFILEDADKSNVIALIEGYISLDSINTELCKRVLRYIILDGINQSGKDVLNKVEDIYSDFGYPEDMVSFISYMPTEDTEYNPSKHTKEDNEQRLVNKFNEFLQSELQLLKQRCDIK